MEPDVTFNDLSGRVTVPREELIDAELGPLGDPLASVDGLSMSRKNRSRTRRVLLRFERPLVPGASLFVDDL